jgi:hypothetical protein
MFDDNIMAIAQTIKSFAENLIVKSSSTLSIRKLTPGRIGVDEWHVMTDRDFMCLVKFQGVMKQRRLPIFDLIRLRKLKTLVPSQRRFLSAYTTPRWVLKWLKKELATMFPMTALRFFLLVLRISKTNGSHGH